MPRRHPNDPGPSKELGERLAEARRAAGLTQRELAAALALSLRTVQTWEEGAASPYRRLGDLEELLGRPREWILYGGNVSSRRAKKEGPQSPGTKEPSLAQARQLLVGFDQRLRVVEEQVMRLREAVATPRAKRR